MNLILIDYRNCLIVWVFNMFYFIIIIYFKFIIIVIVAEINDKETIICSTMY
jgi:hypothetical protein